MINPPRLKPGQLLYIFIAHHSFCIRVNEAWRIQPQHHRMIFPGLLDNRFSFLIRQPENIHHHIQLIIRHIVPDAVIMEIIIHRSADPCQIGGSIIIQHQRIRIHGNRMAALLIID